MKKYLEAPNRHETGTLISDNYVFLGGSITGAENWQLRARDILLPHFNIFNPRRTHFNKTDSSQERTQIEWEHFYLKTANIILMYFSRETFAPITLFETGKELVRLSYFPWKKLYICIHPEYKRKNDVIIQAELENPDTAKKIKFNLEEACSLIAKENINN